MGWEDHNSNLNSGTILKILEYKREGWQPRKCYIVPIIPAYITPYNPYKWEKSRLEKNTKITNAHTVVNGEAKIQIISLQRAFFL